MDAFEGTNISRHKDLRDLIGRFEDVDELRLLGLGPVGGDDLHRLTLHLPHDDLVEPCEGGVDFPWLV